MTAVRRAVGALATLTAVATYIVITADPGPLRAVAGGVLFFIASTSLTVVVGLTALATITVLTAAPTPGTTRRTEITMTSLNTTPRPSKPVVACDVSSLRDALDGLPDDMQIVIMLDDADEADSYADLKSVEVATYVEEPEEGGLRYIPEVRDLGEDDDAQTVLYLIPA